MTMQRQGDVLVFVLRAPDVSVERVTTLPNGLVEVPRENGRIVLAHGEVTGHMHAIDAPPSVAQLFQVPGQVDRILRAWAPVRLYHDEHGDLELPAGDYVVRRQREYRWGQERRVAD